MTRKDADDARVTATTRNAQPRRTTPWREEGTQDRGVIAWLRPARRRILVALVLVVLGVNWYLGSKVAEPEQPAEIPYTMFRAEVKDGNVRSVSSVADELEGTLRTPITFPRGSGERIRRFQTLRPPFDDTHLLGLLERNNVEIRAQRPEARPLWQILALSFGPTLLLVAAFVWLVRRTGAFRSMTLGNSRATRYTAEEGRATFDDVAGIEESKAELVEIVDFLRDPERYWELGAAIPRGVLLSGSPGTGKTLLARAVAGQADVPFFSLSGSEFIELVVGVGASRVRDLFKQAKEAAPAIIFIDELDAVGRSRGDAGLSAGHQEREQTLNQILTEMDGFSRTDGVIVIAATNRPEVLDSALLRPGRFDRRVVVSAPDQTGRREILEVHTRGVPLAEDVDLARIASATPGMVGAELRNLVNEAALQAARHRQDEVTARDFGDALEKVVLGTERHITISDEERRRTAYHEAGHALLGMLDPKADAIRKVSIVPRGQALGVTFQSPDVDRYGYESGYLKSRIVGALGGRAAEDLVLNSITSGAENDLEQVTRIARQMIGRWGMSDAVGPVSVLPRAGQPDYPGMRSGASEGTRQLVDAEVRRLIDECYSVALGLLHDNRDRLERLAEALLERETLDGDEAYVAAGFIAPNGDGPTPFQGGAPPSDGRSAPARAHRTLRPL